MADGLVGRVSSHALTAFVLFIVLVWVAVALGKVLPALLPVPHAVRVLMDPNGGGQGYGAGQPQVEQQ